ncbi:uncharacterized protein si:dkey-20i10.7 [Astyanax mexicanus]|uniref:uncharacterized protein si:dkey-20i10.7 n=1 Tax=Astyanax mexicanus TaxID=7994 RepID=UPI0020CAD059|nr:uncharacterized protein si:dkey-20i10.7 [Astyanax mexicanus]
MVKRCAWGSCKSDTRYPNRVQGVVFYPFPKPKTNLQKCQLWIRLCGRPHSRLNMDTITKNTYVCSKHFVNGAPTDEFPDPLDALDEKDLPKSPPEKKQRFEKSEARIETVEIIPSINTDLVCEDDPQRDLQNNVDTGTRLQHMAVISTIKSTSVEDSLRMTAYIQAEEIEHLKKQLSNMEYTSVTPELINNSSIANYFEFCTGFTFDMFNALCTFLRVPSDCTTPQTVNPLIYTKETRHTKTVPLRSQFLLVLMKLRNNYDTKDLAFKFQVDVQSVSLIINAWINYLYLRLGQISLWPHRDVISAQMPDNFKREFPTTFAIMDCIELRLERPTSLLLPSQTFSDSKTTNSLKGLVICDPRGSILFVSTLYTGTISDRDVFRQCGITTQLYHLIETGYLNPGDRLMADKGFQNQKDVEEIGLSLNIPLFAQRNRQLPFLGLQKKKMAKYRMHVKKAVAKIKKFKIVSEKIPNSILGNINQIWFVVSMLTNFQPHISGH